ncbi:hypothetical protein C8J57DRAFT_1130116 [Mycena rebaudengoi]|nr:hypothetical protein C8J57DRAFT_1130116 [Mycena rebaudengoi]
MFTTFVLLATAAVASAASSNPYIPEGISAGCSSYLDTLNSDSSLASCTTTLITASSSFGPGANATTATPSKASITAALEKVCSSSTSATCSSSVIGDKLATFAMKCSPELTSTPNARVKLIYDTFYSLLPLLATVCSKDDSGAYCLLSAKPSGTDGKTLLVSTPLARRAADTVTAYMPNADTIGSSNLLFLFLNGDLPKDALCTSCTRSVLSKWIGFETNTTYAPGLGQSVLMKNQGSLYSGVLATCGQDFLTQAVQAQGGLGNTDGLGESGALAIRASGVMALLVGALGVAAVVL